LGLWPDLACCLGGILTRLAGIVLGSGLGGFVDGITLHQIMQWLNMGSALLTPTTMAALAQNMVWDGLFQAAPPGLTLFGVLMRWSDGVAGLTLHVCRF
jgi:uncharacterized membrane protein